MPLLTQTKPTLPTGFQVLKNIFSPDELTRARAAQDDLLAGQPNLTPPFHWPAPRDRRHVRSWKMPYATHFHSGIANLTLSPTLGQAIATATGAHTVRLWLDQLLLEQSARPNTPPKYHWHTERSRWKTCACDLMVTAWIPLTEIIPNLGPLTLVRHTARHQWLNLPNNYQPDPNDLLPAPLQPGDALLFCWHTVHGNPPNFSQKPRRALAAHFALNQINYQPHGNFSHHNEKVVSQSKNLPNFQDPHVCPLLKINPPSNKNHYKYIKC